MPVDVDVPCSHGTERAMLYYSVSPKLTLGLTGVEGYPGNSLDTLLWEQPHEVSAPWFQQLERAILTEQRRLEEHGPIAFISACVARLTGK